MEAVKACGGVWRTGFRDVWFDVFMSKPNDATSKAFWLSKTFWANLLMVLSLVSPAVQAWAAENPAALPVIFAFVNLLLRTVTNKAITISGDVSENDGEASGGSGGILPLAFFAFCAACLLMPSCSGEYPVTGSITYRDPDSGAKGGLTFTPGEKPSGFIRVPIYDPETGEQIGQAELGGPLAGAVEPSGK